MDAIVDERVGFDGRAGVGADGVVNARVRVRAAQNAEQGRGEHHVAEATEFEENERAKREQTQNSGVRSQESEYHAARILTPDSKLLTPISR